MTWSAVVTGCLSFGFCCYDKILIIWKSNWGEWRDYLAYTFWLLREVSWSLREVRAGTELESQGARRKAAYWRSPHACWARVLILPAQGVTARWWHCPPTSVINWRKCPQTCPQVSVIEVVPQLRPPFLGMFRFVFNCQKLTRILSEHSMSDQVVVAPNITQQCQGDTELLDHRV